MPAVGISMHGPTRPYIVMLTAIIAAMGAFVFGYVAGISGGVPFPEESLPLVLWKKPAMDVSNVYFQYGSFLAVLVWSLFASRITRRFGCKMSMLFGGVRFCAGAILNVGAAVQVHGIGFANQVVRCYKRLLQFSREDEKGSALEKELDWRSQEQKLHDQMQLLAEENVSLQRKIACLRTKETQLSKSLEKERQRAAESRQEYLVMKEEADTKEGRASQLEEELREMKRKHKQDLHEGLINKELLQQCQDRNVSLRREVRDNKMRLTGVEIALRRESETLLTSLLRDKLHSKEREVEQLQAELAATAGGANILQLEVQVLQNQVMQYNQTNMLLNSEMDALRSKLQALEKEILVKEAQTTILKFPKQNPGSQHSTPSQSNRRNKKKVNLFSGDCGGGNGEASGSKVSVLNYPTGQDISEQYDLAQEIGRGAFGVTYLCTDLFSGEKYACKSISKKKLLTQGDIDVVRREVDIMRHLTNHYNVVSLKDTYEDDNAIYIIMELCGGGDLFERIAARKHYTEQAAAAVMQRIVKVVSTCHLKGVMHRDLKPENFLFANKKETSPLKVIDFGLSTFFKPGERFNEIVGTVYYMAPEVLKQNYGPEIDVWSAGVILYALLSGSYPFWADTQQGITEAILRSVIDFKRDPWPTVSDNAKDLVRKMLDPDAKRRLTAQEVLEHTWMQNAKKAPNVQRGDTVKARREQF